ncbi:1-acylglycerol-3-phosphate O-acyltransferase [Teratosphaeriaceae sp. CCFEE 6253]|nr:1-acylglycerol-3-phosphate O-acyltransferase [Teratosphaeriaceae sp. CCFEE 6253]
MNLFLLSLLILVVADFAVIQLLLLSARITKNHVLEYYGRAIASFSALGLCAIYGTVVSAIINLAGYGGLGQWTTARAFKWSMWFFTGVWFEVHDEKDWLGTTRPAVLVGNHQTELDVLVLGHVFPRYCSVTAKKSLKYIPFLGWFMALSKTVFIERTSREQAVAAFAKAAEHMHSIKQSVYIFPEGTRSYYDHPDLLPYKKGAFHLAVQAQVPIIPVVVANYSNVLNVKRKVFRQGTIPITILEPVQTKGKTKEDVDELLETVRSRMLQELKVLTSQARADGIALQPHDASAATNGTAKASGADTRYNAAA